MPSNSLYSIYYRNFICARILNQNITNDVKIFVPLARNCMGSACTTYALLSVLIRDGFGACFIVPEVVQTILHFGDTVAGLILVKNVLFWFVRKIHEVTPTHF